MSESLIGSRDRESSLFYSDLVVSEEFLGSHTLRIPVSSGAGGRDDPSVRDGRGKAKQVTTANGRTVILRDNSVYSNKGESTCNDRLNAIAPNNEPRLQVVESGTVAVRCFILRPHR